MKNVQGQIIDRVMIQLNELERGMIESINKSQEMTERRFHMMILRLDEVEKAICTKKMKVVDDDDAEDRKRLKERLKEALDENKRTRPDYEVEKEDWLEYIFGICRPDGRIGKEGSRSGSINKTTVNQKMK
jgi:hypothetical protein